MKVKRPTDRVIAAFALCIIGAYCGFIAYGFLSPLVVLALLPVMALIALRTASARAYREAMLCFLNGVALPYFYSVVFGLQLHLLSPG